MLYHYFGGKYALYIAGLEEVLARLRREKRQLDFEDVAHLEGLLHLFDFIDGHFARHPELRCLLAFEHLNRASPAQVDAHSDHVVARHRPDRTPAAAR